MGAPASRGRRRERRSGGRPAGLLIVGGVLAGVVALAVGAWYFWSRMDRTDWGLPEWRKFTPPGGEFTVLMPGDAKAMAPPGSEGGGDIRSYVASPNDKVAFIAQVTDLPPAMEPFGAALDRPHRLQLRGAARMVEGLPVSDEPVTHRGFPGRQIVARNDRTGKTVVLRLLVGQTDRGIRVFTVGAAGPNYGPDSAAVCKLVNSLEITGARPPDKPPSFGNVMYVVVVGPRANRSSAAVVKAVQARLDTHGSTSHGVATFSDGEEVRIEAEPVLDPERFAAGWEVGRVVHRSGRVMHVTMD